MKRCCRTKPDPLSRIGEPYVTVPRNSVAAHDVRVLTDISCRRTRVTTVPRRRCTNTNVKREYGDRRKTEDTVRLFRAPRRTEIRGIRVTENNVINEKRERGNVSTNDLYKILFTMIGSNVRRKIVSINTQFVGDC